MARKNIDLSKISEEDLLNVKVCDLPIKIEDTWISNCIRHLYKELNNKGIVFKPVCYLADEWLAPDNEPVIGIPFFLVHPVLSKLERKMMFDVEGGTNQWCMKLLRHETGHAINYAYKLYKRKKWQKVFGKFSTEYEDTYRFRPYSKNFVIHLEDYYAQHHPDEDFAETFSVWLTPGLDWRKQYKGWGAFKKLKYVDELMGEIKNKEPVIRKGKKYWQAKTLRITLKNYYKKKKHSSAEYFPDFHDANLRRIFIVMGKRRKLPQAADIIKRYNKEIVKNVYSWTREKKYIINDLLKTIIDRCRSLKLRVQDSELIAILKISTYITTLVMNYRYTGKFRGKK
ncbi:MAG: hypothetical protein JSV34_00310 [Candidatus Omnitrophota bacterium]|nr:MAG: hypothetical protein JSV34_00310 [Candidatus Omnitrophota bacterium]